MFFELGIDVISFFAKFLMEFARDILWRVVPVILIVMCSVITLEFFPDIWGRLTLGFTAVVLVCIWYRNNSGIVMLLVFLIRIFISQIMCGMITFLCDYAIDSYFKE